MKRLRALVVAVGLLAAGCGGGEPPPREVRAAAKVPAWQDVFDGTPEVLGVVRPKALVRDGVYGNLFRTLTRATIAKSALRGTSAIEIVEGCDEVVFAMMASETTGRPSGTLVLSGVAPAYDPARLVDEGGQPLLRLRDERATVPEYVPASGTGTGALFVLPGRTWMVTEGPFTARARQAFAAPAGRPRLRVDDTALFAVRVGNDIVSAPRYVKSPVFGPVVQKLDGVTVALDPAGKGLRVALAYANEDAAAYGEMQARRLVTGLAESDPKRFAWLAETTGTRSGNTVTLRAPIPPRLLEDLPKALSPDVLGL